MAGWVRSLEPSVPGAGDPQSGLSPRGRFLLPSHFWEDHELRRSVRDSTATTLPRLPGAIHQPRVTVQEDTDREALIRHLSVGESHPRSSDGFIVVSKWAGCVIEVGRDRFWASLVDVVGRDDQELEGEFPMEEVSDPDIGLVCEGAEFYWAVGYRIQASGQRSRESLLRFRRLPAWSSEEVERALERANLLTAEYGGNRAVSKA